MAPSTLQNIASGLFVSRTGSVEDRWVRNPSILSSKGNACACSQNPDRRFDGWLNVHRNRLDQLANYTIKNRVIQAQDGFDALVAFAYGFISERG